MRSDIALGTVTVLMAVLGSIVSLYPPNRRWQKWTYVVAFAVLGIFGFYFVVKQSNETAVVNEHLKASIDGLSKASRETATLERLNLDLQAKLLEQSGTIASLARENVSQVTGAGTFCYFLVAPNLGSGNPVSFPLEVFVQGRYPMREVTSVIQKRGEFAVTENQLQPTLPLPKTILPGVGPVDYRLGIGEYHIQTWCAAGGPINEVIRLKMVDGKLDQNIEVWGWGKRLYKLGHENLGFARSKRSSP